MIGSCAKKQLLWAKDVNINVQRTGFSNSSASNNPSQVDMPLNHSINQSGEDELFLFCNFSLILCALGI